MPFPADSPSGMAMSQMVEAMKAGASMEIPDMEIPDMEIPDMEIPDMEIHPKDFEQKYGVLLSPNDGSKCHVIDSLANIQPLTARDLFDPALQKATMYALGCKSMKEVKAKFAKKCACGSGKKFKNCCLQKVLDEANAEEPQQDEPKARGPYQLLTSVDDLAFFGGPPGMRGSHPPYQEEVEEPQ